MPGHQLGSVPTVMRTTTRMPGRAAPYRGGVAQRGLLIRGARADGQGLKMLSKPRCRPRSLERPLVKRDGRAVVSSDGDCGRVAEYRSARKRISARR